MAGPTAVLQAQVARVRRRLVLQRLLDRVVLGVAAATAVATLWFLAQPYLVDTPAPWLRWAVAGGLAAAGLAAAVVAALLRAPERLAAALFLDERFGLRERVTTSLGLTPAEEATPAGQALLLDASQRVAMIDVGSRFPVRLTQRALALPVVALLFGAVALFYQPTVGQASGQVTPRTAEEAKAEEERKQREEERRVAKAERKQGDPPSPNVQEWDDELDNIKSRPRSTREEQQDRLKELTALEEQLREREKQLAAKDREVKERLAKLDREPTGKPREEQRDELRKALSEGDFQNARDEVERLAKKMEQGELSKEEQDQLEKKVKELQDELERLSRNREEKERLQKKKERGEIDQETLDREMDKLKEEEEQEQDLSELAEELGECAKCLSRGEGKQAASKMRKAAKKLQQLQRELQELKDVCDRLEEVDEAKVQCQECQGDKAGQKPGSGLGQGPKGVGPRPEKKIEGAKSIDARERGKIDPRGEQEVIGFAPGRSFKKKTAGEVEGEVKQAVQEAPEAIERQRVPRAARDMARGFFENLGGQKEKAEGKK